MTTLQEQFEKDFPNKSVEKIEICGKYENTNFTNYDLDLSEYVNSTKINCSYNGITSLNISGLTNLTIIVCNNNNLTSVDFFNDLPHPKRLEKLAIFNIKIS